MKRRSIASYFRAFGGTRQISVGFLSFALVVPAFLAGLFVLAVASHHLNHVPLIVAPFAALVGGLVGLAAWKLSWKAVVTALLIFGMATGGSGKNPPPQADPTMVNNAARALVLSQAVEMEQQIFSQAINPVNQTVIPIVPRNVGIIKRFRVIVSGNIQNLDAAIDAVATPFGISNVMQNINFVDLQNNVRVNTTGWHVFNLSAAKYRDPYGNSLTAADYLAPNGATSTNAGNYGNNFPVIVNLNGLTHGTNQNFRIVYEVPLSYSDDDLRGAIFANVVNATMLLTLTLASNAQGFVATAADDTAAILRSGTVTYNGNVTVTVYQVYLDQLPQDTRGGAVLPLLDLSTVYEIKNTTFQNLVANQEFPVPYANFRDFLSTFAVYNNNGGNGGHGNGTDINYFSLQSANFTNIWKLDPLSLVERWRKIIDVDFPPGMYYVSYRRRPISTVQYGNMQLILNPITAAANNYLLIGYEAFALQTVLTQAGSLAAA